MHFRILMIVRNKTRLAIGLSIAAFLFAVVGLLALLSLSQFSYRLSQTQGIGFRTTYSLATVLFIGGLFCGVAAFCLAQYWQINSGSSGFIRGGVWAGALVSLIGLAMLYFDVGNWGIHSIPSASNICINNLRTIDKAKEGWISRIAATNGMEAGWDKIAGDFPNGFPICPEGGKYELGRVGEPVLCSNPNHRIPSH